MCSLCVRVRGGGVLAGVEQSCNEQILESESKKQERTDDLVESGYYNNNPDLGERWHGEDKGERRGIISASDFCIPHLHWRESPGSRPSREEEKGEEEPGRYSHCFMSAKACVQG